MAMMEQFRNLCALKNSKSLEWFFKLLVPILIGLAIPACEYPQLPGYQCDKTNNCADVPTTSCEPKYNLCLCPAADIELIWCPKYRRCVSEPECYIDPALLCDAGYGGEGGGGNETGGGGGNGGAGGNGGLGGQGN